MFIDPNELLLEDRYSPITSSMGFFEAPCGDVVKQFIEWQKEIRKGEGIIRRFTKRIKSRKETGSLEQVIRKVVALKSYGNTLFVPTNQKWLDSVF